MSSANTSRFIAKTIQASGYGKFGMNDNERKLEIAKGIIARLKDNLEDQSATITQLTASNTSKQNIIDEMIEDGCCRAFIDEIMSDAEKDCAKSVQESIEAVAKLEEVNTKFEAVKKLAVLEGRVLKLASKSIMLDQLSEEVECFIGDDSLGVGSVERLLFGLAIPDNISLPERQVLGLVQGSEEDYQKECERNMLADMVKETLEEYYTHAGRCLFEVGDARKVGDACWQINIIKTHLQ
tara:strand:+ start:3408 stop:4124 length:717 start_codon:yes stop_codon:yes gene_type:complete